jgi:hypothetical protein
LEVSSKRAVEVGKALSRIQGASRLQIEDSRRKARLTAQANKAQILRDQYRVGQERAMPKWFALLIRRHLLLTKPDVAANDPFANPEKMQDGAPTVDENKPATPATPAADGDNPFGDDAPAKPEPAGDDPFGGSGGSAKPAEDDPFGGN